MHRIKSVHLLLLAVSMVLAGFFSCKKDLHSPEADGNTTNSPEAAMVDIGDVTEVHCSLPVTLDVQEHPDGTSTWTWTVPNNLSSPINPFGMALTNCTDAPRSITTADVVSAFKSSDGDTWEAIEFGDHYPRAVCVSGDAGAATNNQLIAWPGAIPAGETRYFRLVVNGHFETEGVVAQYRYVTGSGQTRMNNCGACMVPGIGCRKEKICSYSQGYWFAKPDNNWPDKNGAETEGVLTLGGFHYTQDNGRWIWNTSNAGGKDVIKALFLQSTAITLSGAASAPDVSECVETAYEILGMLGVSVTEYLSWSVEARESWLSEKGISEATVGATAECIASWIDANHCEDIE